MGKRYLLLGVFLVVLVGCSSPNVDSSSGYSGKLTSEQLKQIVEDRPELNRSTDDISK